MYTSDEMSLRSKFCFGFLCSIPRHVTSGGAGRNGSHGHALGHCWAEPHEPPLVLTSYAVAMLCNVMYPSLALPDRASHGSEEIHCKLLPTERIICIINLYLAGDRGPSTCIR
jgi:hypothetical protein